MESVSFSYASDDNTCFCQLARTEQLIPTAAMVLTSSHVSLEIGLRKVLQAVILKAAP